MDNGKLCENISTVFIKPHPPSSTLLLLLFFFPFLTCNPQSKQSRYTSEIIRKNPNPIIILAFCFFPFIRINHWKILRFRIRAENPGERIKMLFFFNMKKDSRSAIVSFVCSGYGILIYSRVIFYLDCTSSSKN